MKKVLMPPKLENVYDYDNGVASMHGRSENHMTLKMQDWHTKRYEKVTFDIRKRALVYHGMPVQLEAKAPLPYSITYIAKRKIKRGNYGRCRSS